MQDPNNPDIIRHNPTPPGQEISEDNLRAKNGDQLDKQLRLE